MDRILPTLLVAAISGAVAAVVVDRLTGDNSQAEMTALADQVDDGIDEGNPCLMRPELCLEDPPADPPPDVLAPPSFVSDAQDDVYLIRESYVIPKNSSYLDTYFDYFARCEQPDIALAPGWKQSFSRNAKGSTKVNRIEWMTPVSPNTVRYSIFSRKLDRPEFVAVSLTCQDTIDWCPCFDADMVAETAETSCVQASGADGMRASFESRPAKTFATAQVVPSTSQDLAFRTEPRCEGVCRTRTKGARYACRSQAGERAITLRDYRACQRQLTRGLGMITGELCLPEELGAIDF